MTDSEIVERIRYRIIPTPLTSVEAFRDVDENTPLGVQEVLNRLLRVQSALLGYVQLADLEDLLEGDE